jgi:tetratricopeptide (TPR) repeat protein
MAVFESEDRSRQKRARSEQAIGLATKGRWEDAARVNREIVDLFPNDVDAHNRLGKALMELGRYGEAREAYARAAKIDPMNSIAVKNLQRLTKLGEEGATAPPPTAVDPRLFIEESGKTTVTQLTDVRRKDSVAKLTAGDQLKLETRGNQIAVVDFAGQEIGRIEPRLEQHLIDLLKMGNEYAVFITSASDHSVNVIIRETHRSPAMGNRPSFRPSAAPEGAFRAYTREGALRYELEEEEEELLEEEEEEVEPEVTHAEVDAVEETPLETLAAEEEGEEPQ